VKIALRFLINPNKDQYQKILLYKDALQEGSSYNK